MEKNCSAIGIGMWLLSEIEGIGIVDALSDLRVVDDRCIVSTAVKLIIITVYLYSKISPLSVSLSVQQWTLTKLTWKSPDVLYSVF